ncbi:T9SS type A sorting domain-containing protein, partial [Candidatus Woesebacteria bacterium]|nr:T9SS type A sorting domain-containing protein [Candidatus Woesebacteria bacterium]
SSPIGVQIEQETYTYYEEPFNDFMIIKYSIKNLNSRALSNFFAGIFVDWDISEDASDYADFDANSRLSWVLDNELSPTFLSGTKLLSSDHNISFRAIHNPDEIYDGFTTARKWGFLSNGIQTTKLSYIDVSTLLSAGPLSFEPGEVKTIAFALIAGESVKDFKNNAENAQILWDNDLYPVIDSSPPELTTSLILNPANSKYCTVTVVSDKVLENPPSVSIIDPGDTTTVSMVAVANSNIVFSGQHQFAQPGIYSIETYGKGKFSRDTTTTRDFTITNFIPQNSLTSQFPDGTGELSLNENALNQNTFLLQQTYSENDEKIYDVSPYIELSEMADLVIDVPQTYDSENWGIGQWNGSEWQPLNSEYISAAKIKTQTAKLGRFKLMAVSLTDIENQIPTQFKLKQNYPNPFNPSTVMGFDIANSTNVKIHIFNIRGQLISSFDLGQMEAGQYTQNWDATNLRGQIVPAGIYFYQIITDNWNATRKMLLVR